MTCIERVGEEGQRGVRGAPQRWASCRCRRSAASRRGWCAPASPAAARSCPSLRGCPRRRLPRRGERGRRRRPPLRRGTPCLSSARYPPRAARGGEDPRAASSAGRTPARDLNGSLIGDGPSRDRTTGMVPQIDNSTFSEEKVASLG